MLLEQFRTNFPPDSEIPALLIQLLDYQNATADWYSGRFELTGYGANDTVAWFDGDTEAATQFVPFGAGPDGSSYCYWLYPGRSLATAPIVFLGSEGVACTVLTNTTEEFLALLAIGYKELGFADLNQPEPDTTNVLRFRAWLQTEFGIHTPQRGAEIIAQAKARHPDLEQWIQMWAKARYGTD